MATDNPVETPDTGQPPIEEEKPGGATIPNWEYKNIPDFYNRVRGALNVGNVLTDITIDYFENAPRAEMAIKKRVPQWQDLDTEKRLLFETCIIYQTCYILCPQFSSNRITKMKDPSLEINYSTSANEKPCARFAELVDDLIAQINDEEQPPFFFGFEVTPSTRSGCCCHKKIFPHILNREPDYEEPIVEELPATPDSPNEDTPLGSEGAD